MPPGADGLTPHEGPGHVRANQPAPVVEEEEEPGPTSEGHNNARRARSAILMEIARKPSSPPPVPCPPNALV